MSAVWSRSAQASTRGGEQPRAARAALNTGARTLVVRRSVCFGPNDGRRARLLHLRAPRALARELRLLRRLCCVTRALFRAAARLCGGVALRRVDVLSAQPRRALRQRGVGRLHACDGSPQN